jgi:hypothetical protein
LRPRHLHGCCLRLSVNVLLLAAGWLLLRGTWPEKSNGLPNGEARTHAYVGVRLHEYYDDEGRVGTHWIVVCQVTALTRNLVARQR